ncbi:MAG: hypothetical protein RLY58_383 [Pseudomonadota bacterium]|jgi:hypothetical protein
MRFQILALSAAFGLSCTFSNAAPIPRLSNPSDQMMTRAKALLDKPATWNAIPSSVNLCLYSPDGVKGKAYEYAMSYLSEMPKYTKLAQQIGVDFNVTFKPPFEMQIDLASKALKRKASTKVHFQIYTDERVAAEDFKAKRCDGIAMSNLRARQFNRFVGSLDAIGAVPSYQHLTQVIQLLARPEMAKDMVNQDYEITGIIPMGAAYVMVNDRRINTLAKAAGKKIAVMDFDKSQAMMVQRIGAQPVSVDLTSLAGKFNNGQVDIMAGPALIFDPFELYKGMTDKNLQVRGAIIRFPLLQVTGVMMMHRGRFPDGLGQLVREYAATQLEPAYHFVNETEQSIPAKYWMDVPAADKPGYIKLMREARLDMVKAGYYDPRMMSLLKHVRCTIEPTQYECSLNDE